MRQLMAAIALLALAAGCQNGGDKEAAGRSRREETPATRDAATAATPVSAAAGRGKSARGTPILVDWGATHQKIVGFGGTMGWIHPHPERSKEVFDLLFSKLGASVLRIQALGGEGGDEESLEPENDNDDPDTFDWEKLPIAVTEAKNAAIIKAALERGVQTVIPVTWSPPGWMKTTGMRAGGGELMPELIDEYAETWAAYVIGMKREFDVDIRLVSIQNEPDLTYYYPTCRWEPGIYARTVAAVQARMKREKLDVQVLTPDTCRIYNLPRYLDALNAAGIGRGSPILTHLYDLSIPYERVDKDAERWRAARELAVKYGRPLWLMETANYLSHGIEPASYEEALVWAQKIHWALVEGHCEMVCWWALFFDKKGESLIYCRESECEEFEITPKFYTSMNYFKFVRPGMVRCEAAGADGVLASAFRGSDGRRVIVLVNTRDDAHEVRLPDAREWKRFETTEKKNCEQAKWNGRKAVLPARSVTTFAGRR